MMSTKHRALGTEMQSDPKKAGWLPDLNLTETVTSIER